jgi:HEAT repeat protein
MMTTAELIKAYRRAAILHGTATTEGPPKVANKAFEECTRLSHFFRRGDADRKQVFLSLLDDENLFVRSSAAVHALEIDPDQAVAVLEEIAAGPRSWVRMGAEIILERWKDGSFHIP